MRGERSNNSFKMFEQSNTLNDVRKLYTSLIIMLVVQDTSLRNVHLLYETTGYTKSGT